MKRILFFALQIAFLQLLSSCEEGIEINKEIEIETTYTKLVVEDKINVEIDTLATKISFSCGDKLMPKIQVKKENETLIIKSKKIKNIRGEVKVVLPYNANLTSISLKGLTRFYSPKRFKGKYFDLQLDMAAYFCGGIETDELNATLYDASSFSGVANCSNFTLNLVGKSYAHLSGFCEQIYLSIDGTSELKELIENDEYSLKCNHCKATLNNNSNAYLHCNISLTTEVDATSKFYYTGNATVNGSAQREEI